MWKRMINHLSGKRGRGGFTLLEMMAVVAIIVVLCGIVVISAATISKNLKFQEYNDQAKTIFMAAQSNLSDMRSNGSLVKLRAEDVDRYHIDANLRDKVDFPEEDWTAEYSYTGSKLPNRESFDMVLPVNSVEGSIRDKDIIIEYNPVTGNVYAVFYSQKDNDLLKMYLNGSIPRDEETRKELGIGYYCGSGLSSQELELTEGTARLEFVNGEEGILRISIAVPESFRLSGDAFVEGLDVKLKLTGEISGNVMELDIMDSDDDDLASAFWESGTLLQLDYVMDSLADHFSFANLAAGTNGVSLVTIANESSFTFLPGENLTVQAEARYTGNGAVVDIAPGILPGVNPMFDYLVPGTSAGKYILAVSNGRNLQNLNALAPSVADKVELVVFADDIYWEDTVTYYNNVYGEGATYANAADEAPGRALPYFVPIHNELLLGTAHFSNGDQTQMQYGQEVSLSGGKVIFRDYADVVGNGKMVVGLNIDSTKYVVQSPGEYYVTRGYTNADGVQIGGDQAVSYAFTGLFAYANTNISDLNIVNSYIKGIGSGYQTPATGSLLGAAGPNALISDCGVYIVTDPGKVNGHYTYTAMSGHGDYDADAVQRWYGVSGEGAVGGLVGYAQSYRTATGDLTDDTDQLSFIRCFSAVPVSGKMRGNGKQNYGYTNGVGGLVGVSHLSNFYSCYSSSGVIADGVYVEGKTTPWASISMDGTISTGAGGFIGTSHGSRFTNCFASGEVVGKGRDAGVGGFVGVMCYDGGLVFQSGASAVTRQQLTIFDSCYTAGEVSVNGKKSENFAGGIASNKLRDYIAADSKVYTDYYLMYAPYRNDGNPSGGAVVPDLNAGGGGRYFYMYKDCYFLSRARADSKVEPNANGIGGGASYESLMEMLANHGREDTPWIISQVFSYYMSSPMLIFDFYSQLWEGYPSDSWTKATEDITHAYTFTGGTYLFPMLSGMEYYGDWPTFPLTGGLAYYEYYGDSSIIHAQFDREDTGTLLDAQYLRDHSLKLVSDGYAVVACSAGQTVKVTVGDKTYTLSGAGVKDWKYGAEDRVLYPLTNEILAAAAAQGEYYTKMTIKIGDEPVYVVYFNPNVANSQINPIMTSATSHSNPAKPKGTPDHILIRSARQLAALSNNSTLWDNEYYYIQMLDIYADAYNALGYSDSDKAAIKAAIAGAGSIGSEAMPFQGSYTGFGGNQVQTVISDYKTGIFGLLDGTVKDLKVIVGSASAGADDQSYVGIVADINAGTLDNVDVIVNGTVSLKAGTGVGLLAGKSSGEIKNCDIIADQAVTLEGLYAGGAVGELSGTVTGSSLNTKGNLNITAVNGGGFAGVVAAKSRSNIQKVTVKLDGGLAFSVREGNTPKVGGFTGAVTSGRFTDVSVTMNGTVGCDKPVVVGGVAGTAADASFNRISATVNGTLTGDLVAGLVVELNDAEIDNSTVAVKGTISGGTAAGAAANIAVDSTVSGTTVNINGGKITADACAVGFAASVSGKCSGSMVCLNNGTVSGVLATGFAYSVSGEVSGYCAVTGNGTILGSDKVAGFAANVSGTVAAARVTPAAKQNPASYWQNSNDNLKVSGGATGTAAGFVLNVDAGGVVRNCDTLCTVTGASVSGFGDTNKGTIEGCIANVTISGGYAFVRDNSKGAVKNCYGWYGDGSVDNSTTVTTVGHIGCYFVDRDLSEEEYPDAKPVVLVDSKGNRSETLLSNLIKTTSDLNGGTSGKWFIPGTYAAYPYSKTASYPFPMLREHCGDWTSAAIQFYGVVYYELYDDASVKFHAVDLSGTDKGVSFYAVNETVQSGNCFDNQGTITSAGYLLFCESGRDPFGGELLGKVFTGNSIIRKVIRSQLDNNAYEVYELNASEMVEFVTNGKTVAVYPYFADAIGVSDNFQLRTPDQMAHMYKVDASFAQTIDLVLPSNFNTVDGNLLTSGVSIGAGRVYNGYGNTIVAHWARNTWLRNLDGQLKSLTIILSSMEDDFIENISDTAVLDDISLIIHYGMPTKGAFFGTCSGKVDIRSLYVNADTVEGKLVSKITGGTFNIGHIECRASGSTVGTLFGEISGGVVNGGTVSLSKTNVEKPLFGSVVGGAVVKNFDITVDSLKASLVGTLTGTLENISISTDNASMGSGGGVLVANVLEDKDAFGDPIPVVIRNCTVNITTVNANGDAFGAVTDGLPSDAVVSGCKVTIGTINADCNLIGGLVGRNQGTLKDNTVKVNIACSDAATVGGLVGINEGTISGNTVEVNIRYTQTKKERAKATIGGLVGEMEGGSISGMAGATTVTGSIELVSEAVTTDNRQYIIGGAIGRDNTLYTASYSNITANVTVDEDWAGTSISGEVDLAGKGPVGMFVGYATDGTFKNCSSIAANEIYYFAGAVSDGEVETKNSNWFSHGTNSAEVLSYPMGDAGRLSVVAANNGYSALANGQKYKEFTLTLDNCTYILKGGKFKQSIHVKFYLFTGEQVGDQAVFTYKGTAGECSVSAVD